MRHLTFILLLLIVIPNSLFAQTDVGEEVSDFTYTAFSSETQINLSDQRGTIVYLFLFGANCSQCRATGYVTESEIYSRFKSNSNFTAFGLQVWVNQTLSQVGAFQEITEITYPLLLGARATMQTIYGNTNSYNRSVIIDSEGKLLYKGTREVNQDYNNVINILEEELEKLVVSSEAEQVQPSGFILHQNHPNPFNPSTVISYQLAMNSVVGLEVFDVMGRKVASLVDNKLQSEGEHSVHWDASSFPSGIYLYRLNAGYTQITKRMMLIK